MAQEMREGPDIEALRTYAILADRQLTPFFAGREEIVGHVEDACRQALEDCRSGRGASGRTWLIQGAPGAGKTSLLRHLEERWRRRGAESPSAVRIRLRHLADHASLAGAVAAAAGEAGLFRTSETRAARADASLVGLAAAGGSRSTEIAPPPASLENLAAARPAACWARPACVMVDEIQAAGRIHAECLRELHLGEHGLPVVPILAGLGNSQDVLDGEDIQLSRISPGFIVDLGRLEPHEARESVRKFLDGCRVAAPPARAEAWAEEIADLSDRWPQFLRSGIAALSAELAAAGGALASVDREAVVDRAARLREEAYGRRRSPNMEGSGALVAGLMRAAGPSGLSRSEALDAIRELDAGPGGPARESLPEGASAGAFLEELIRKGALQRGQGARRDRLACPIPSFRDFLLREGSRVRVIDGASPQEARIAAAACNREHEAGGGRASDLRFLAESGDFGSGIDAVGGRASEINPGDWAEFAAAAVGSGRRSAAGEGRES